MGSYFPCNQWSSALWSPDYFNSCATVSSASTPSNIGGYQIPFDGNAYVGILALNYGDDEFIQTDIPALEVDTEYVVTIHVSCTIKATNSDYAVDGFGVAFNTFGHPPSLYSMGVPQVDYSHYGIISDTVNWVALADTFAADSAYTHLIIGDFNPANRLLLGTDSTNLRAYYYIDGVSVVKKSQAYLLNVLTSAKVEMNIYPNPATTSLTISASDRITAIAITNLLGQAVYTNQYNSTQVQVDVADLPAGVYFVKVNGLEVRKFVKQ